MVFARFIDYLFKALNISHCCRAPANVLLRPANLASCSGSTIRLETVGARSNLALTHGSDAVMTASPFYYAHSLGDKRKNLRSENFLM